MRSVFNESDYRDLVARIEKLPAGAPRQWGKMDVAQMLAHCSETVKVVVGDTVMKRLFIGRIIGPFVKKGYLSPTPFKPGSPTAPSFVVTTPREFEKEKAKLLGLLKRMYEGGEANVTKHPHAFFGKMTPKQWGETQWKHFDHHLRQFGN